MFLYISQKGFHLLNPDPDYSFVRFWFSKTNKNLYRDKKVKT
jgi:hypothetical protein